MTQWMRLGLRCLARAGRHLGSACDVPTSSRAFVRGQVLVLTALGMFVLMGAVGLGVESSRAFEERRAAQTGADHAATAAAYVSCTGGNNAAAQAAGQLASMRNGYDDAAAPIVVTIDPVVGQANTFRAAITSTIQGTFARVLGINTFTVTVEATAGGIHCGAGGAGPGAIYAGGTCGSGEFAVDISGSTDKVYGGVHSNDDARVGGSGNIFYEVGPPTDPFTYVGAFSQSGGNTYDVGYPQQVPLPSPAWPAGWDPSVASPASPANDAFWADWQAKAIADGHGGSLLTNKIDTITTNGVYYTSHADGFDVSSIDPSVTNFTLIARNGPIKISASSRTFGPDADAEGILMLSGMNKPSDKKCSEYTISISGSTSIWNGILWAPGGLIEMSGSSNTTANGSLIGWTVRLNGSNLIIRYDSSLFPPADPTVMIVK
jgi:Flp pilus assembly protein TadG